jgi:hypothetical protein
MPVPKKSVGYANARISDAGISVVSTVYGTISNCRRLMDEDELELHFRVRTILDDLFGMSQDDAQELIDELRDAGIGFREIKNEE